MQARFKSNKLAIALATVIAATMAPMLSLPLEAQQPAASEIDCAAPLDVKLQSSPAGELSLATPRLGNTGPAAYFIRPQPSNLVANGDFEVFAPGWLSQGPFHASLIGPNAIGGQYTPTMTNVTVVPNWTVTGGNATSYIWHGVDSLLLNSAHSSGSAGNGYVYMGIAQQNLLAGGNPFSAPFTATPQGRVVPPGAVTIGSNTYPDYTGRAPSVPHPTGPVAIEQTVNLTVGRNYRMTFYVVGEATQSRAAYTTIDGIFGLDISGYAREHLKVYGYDNNGAVGRYYTVEFTAKQSATTVRFLNWGHATTSPNVVFPTNPALFATVGAATEAAIDDVIINACSAPKQIPTMDSPWAFWALIGGLLLVAGAALRLERQKR